MAVQVAMPVVVTKHPSMVLLSNRMVDIYQSKTHHSTGLQITPDKIFQGPAAKPARNLRVIDVTLGAARNFWFTSQDKLSPIWQFCTMRQQAGQ